MAQYEVASSAGIATPFPVWSDDYQHHYRWCLDQDEETLARGAALRQAQIDAASAGSESAANPVLEVDSTLEASPLPSPATPGSTPVRSTDILESVRVLTGATPLIQTPRPGGSVYSDRPFAFGSLPAALTSGVQIGTANDDKFSKADAPYLSFALTRPAAVYVAYDARYTRRPQWLDSFEATALQVGYAAGSTDIRSRVFRRWFPAGTVELGGNLPADSRENFGMYTVFVVPEEGASGSAVASVEPPGSGLGAPSMVGGASAAALGEPLEFESRTSGSHVGQTTIPLFMHYAERQLVGVPGTDDMDATFNQVIGGAPEQRALFAQLVSTYQAIPEADKLRLFDAQVVQATASPQHAIARAEIDKALARNVLGGPSVGIAASEDPPPPAAPSRLVAVNSSGTSMEQGSGGSGPSLGIHLSWRWDHGTTPYGFAIYRRPSSDTQFQFLTSVPAGETSYRDAPLPGPGGPDSAYCYEVRAFHRPHLTSTLGSSRIESSPSNSSCAAYGLDLPPLPDLDRDGMADPFDWCPTDGYSAEVQRINGCPDLDQDGLPDSIQDPSIPASLRDNCPPGSQADGYGARGPEWDHLRAIDPLPGCPVKYQLRWVGLDIINDPADCTNPNAPDPGCDKQVGLGNEWHQKNEVINGVPLPPGFEPYLVFALLNGISPQGMPQYWTKKWCCGEGVTVGRFPVPDFPPSEIPPGGTEPDTDFSGAEDLAVDRKVREGGWILLPGESNEYVTIDGLGMTLTSTLFERDFDMEYTPKKSEADMNTFLSAGIQTMKSIVGCGGTGGLGCAKALGQSLAAFISFGFESGRKADPVTVEDRDDVMGVVSSSFTRESAARDTAASGVHTFYQEIPDGFYFVTFPQSIVPKPPLNSKLRVVGTMVGRARFCLVRRGLDETEIRRLCELAE